MAPRNHKALERLDGFAFWLADHAELSLLDLHAAFSDELVARGLPLWRSSLGLELLHPEQSGVRSLWTLNEGVKKTLAPRGVENSPDYLNSPVKIVDDTERPFRQKLLHPIPHLPLLEEFRTNGATDYVIYPLPFLDRTRSAYLSFVSKAAAGFAAASRLQNLAKRLGQPVLISNAFANELAEPLIAAGAHAMRDIGRSERVFALPAAA